MNEPPGWHVLADLAPRVRAGFDKACLVRHEDAKRSSFLKAVQLVLSRLRPRTVDLKQEVLEGVFGRFRRDHHAFNAITPVWEFKLDEPHVTKSLKLLLDRGEPELRAVRIRAFLEALQVRELPDDHTLEQANIFAERNVKVGANGSNLLRTDLEIEFPSKADSSLRTVIIEAKFGTPLDNPLAVYRKARKESGKVDCRIIGLENQQPPDPPEDQHWPVLLWRDVWLQFEKRRPKETDGQLATFMAVLWQKIGGLA